MANFNFSARPTLRAFATSVLLLFAAATAVAQTPPPPQVTSPAVQADGKVTIGFGGT